MRRRDTLRYSDPKQKKNEQLRIIWFVVKVVSLEGREGTYRSVRPCRQRYDAIKTVMHPTASMSHKTTLQKINSQGMALARATAGTRSHDQDVEIYDKDTAQIATCFTGGKIELKWSSQIIRLQGQLIVYSSALVLT
eukprot:2846451-Amphidinium_carterae.1